MYFRQEISTNPTQLKETKLPSDSDSIQRSDLQTCKQKFKAGLISQTLKHHAEVNLASLVAVPQFQCLRSRCRRMTTSEHRYGLRASC